MTTNIFIALFMFYSVASGLITEAMKKILDEANVFYATNALALVVAMFLGTFGTLIYYQLTNIPFEINNIICAILLGIMSGVGSMIGYDKIIQLINQYNK